MSAEGVRRRGRRAPEGLPQLPWRTVRNPYRPVEILSADEVEAIHRASLRILARDRRRGPRRPGDRPPGRRRARASTARPARVRLDPAQVEELVAHGAVDVHAPRPQPRPRPRRSAAATSSSRPSAGRPSSPTSTAAGGPATSPTSSTTSASSARSTSSTRRAAARSSRPTCRSRPATSTCTARSRSSSTRRGSAWASGRTVVDDAIEIASLARGVDRDAARRRAEPDDDHQHELAAPPRRPDVATASSRWRPTASRSSRRRSRWPAR